MGMRIPLVDMMILGVGICTVLGTELVFDVLRVAMLTVWLTILVGPTLPDRLVLITKGWVIDTPCLVGCCVAVTCVDMPWIAPVITGTTGIAVEEPIDPALLPRASLD